MMIRRDVTMDLEAGDSHSAVSPNHLLAIGWYCLMLDNEAIPFFRFRLRLLIGSYPYSFGSVCLPTLWIYKLNGELELSSVHPPQNDEIRKQQPLLQNDRTTMVTVTVTVTVDSFLQQFHQQ